MKLSPSSLKGMDFKQILVHHGEKVVLGLAGLLALLALVSARWSTFKKTTPTKMKESAIQAEVAIKASQWPPAEQQQFPEDDTLAGKIEQMLRPINLAYLKPRIDFSFEPYLKDKKLEDPKLFAINEPIATYEQMVLAIPAPVSEYGEGGSGVGEASPMPGERPGNTPSKKAKGLLINQQGGGVGRGGMGEESGGPGSGTVPSVGRGTVPAGGGAGQRFSPQGRGGAAIGAPGVDASGIGIPSGGGMGGGMPGEGGAGSVGGGGYGKGFHVIAVRGVYPLNKQLKEFARALNLPSDDPDSVRYLLEFYDTVVERQISPDRGKTWGKWQAIDSREYADFLLSEIGNYDTEVVNLMVTDPAMTSPLPLRLLWSWGTGEESTASHPALANFHLSPAGRKAQKELLDNIAKQKELVEKQDALNRRKRGFSPASRNFRELGNQIRSNAGLQSEFGSNYDGGMPGERRDPNQVAQDLAKVTAAGHLLLFRYFDFKVEPGLTYRYRVHLKIRNPNFNRPVAVMAAGYENSVNEEFKDTPTSEPTKPVFVPFDVNYFLTSAEVKRTRRLDLVPANVNMLVYQWFSEYGTTVKGELRELSVGQEVQGKDKAIVVEPARRTYLDDQETEFATNVTLVDVDTGTKQVSQDLMDQLGLPTESKGRLPVQDEVLVVDQSGQMKMLDPLSDRRREVSAETAWKTIVEAFEQFKVQTSDEGMPGTLEGLEGGMPGEDSGMSGSGEGSRFGARGASGRSSQRPGRGRRGSGA